ncbi:uncharacterized protein LOC106662081 [Cimex lectularius]|uniref:Osiris 7 n=1 Tax=Cimex lectularius TaxID=79782 RepID=A0A8I6RA30_CIMLE|nr:uncharacterized protein LOC106662081 [Cimex lectularius]
MTKTIGLFFLALGLANALPSMQQENSRNAIQTSDDLVDNIYSDCLNKGSVSCVKYKLFTFVDKVLGSKDSFTLTEGVTLVKNPGAVSGDGAPRSLSADDIQKEDVETLLASRVERFLSTHTLKFDLKGSEVIDAVSSAGRALGDVADTFGLTEEDGNEESGRKKGKKAGKILLPLLLMMKLKAAAMIPVALGAIALIAGKALLIGKIALLLSAIIGLKKLLSHQHKSVTYEIVSHPHHSSSHEHHHEGFSSGGGDVGSFGGGGGGHGGHGGWGRSGDAHDMAYSSYQPKAQ